MSGRIDGRDRGIDSLETLPPQDALRGFFHWADQQHPEGAQMLVKVISGLVPQSDKPIVESDFRKGLTDMNCHVAMNLSNVWLDEVKIGGFRRLGWTDKPGILVAKSKLKHPLPATEAVSDPDTQAVLRAFASAMRRYDQISLSSKGAIGLLLSESIGSQLSDRGSHQLRVLLEQPLQGHFDWLRNALGVRDVRDPQTEAIVGVARAVTEAVTAGLRQRQVDREEVISHPLKPFLQAPLESQSSRTPSPASHTTVTVDFQNETEAQRRARETKLVERIPEPSASVPEPEESFDYRDSAGLKRYFFGTEDTTEKPGEQGALRVMAEYKRRLDAGELPSHFAVAAYWWGKRLQAAIQRCPPDIALPFEPGVPRSVLLDQLAQDLETLKK